MSATGEILAAIDKLTRLRAEADTPTLDYRLDGSLYSDGGEGFVYDLFRAHEDGMTSEGPDGDTLGVAALIVTLYGTMGAMLDLLSEGLTIAGYIVSPDEDAEVANFVTLARAINGKATA